MSFTVMLLADAEQDLIDIPTYIQNRFSTSLANEIYQQIQDDILMLEDNPHLGTLNPQLAELGMNQFRDMVVMKKNRIVYEIDLPNQLIYVFLVYAERQDYDAVLRRRIKRH